MEYLKSHISYNKCTCTNFLSFLLAVKLILCNYSNEIFNDIKNSVIEAGLIKYTCTLINYDRLQ